MITSAGPHPPPAEANDRLVEKMLKDLGKVYLLIDLDFPGADEPFFEPETMYQFRINLQGLYEAVPAEQFDALFYAQTAPLISPLY